MDSRVFFFTSHISNDTNYPANKMLLLLLILWPIAQLLKKLPCKNEMLVKHPLKRKNADFFLGMVIRMSLRLQTNMCSGAADNFFFFPSKKWDILHHGFFVFTVSLLAVLHVTVTNEARTREVLEKGVCSFAS